MNGDSINIIIIFKMYIFLLLSITSDVEKYFQHQSSDSSYHEYVFK